VPSGSPAFLPVDVEMGCSRTASCCSTLKAAWDRACEYSPASLTLNSSALAVYGKTLADFSYRIIFLSKIKKSASRAREGQAGPKYQSEGRILRFGMRADSA